MKKIFTFLLSALICTLVFGQRKEAVIAKAGDVKPVIDGVMDDVWIDVEQHDIFTNFRLEMPTLGAEGESYWKALWDDDGMYVIVVANDDVWSPYQGTGSDYNYDKIEMYFDTNYILEDHLGGQTGTTGNRQIAPNPTLDMLNGEMMSLVVQGGTVNYAFKVDDPAWTTEWFVPWTSIPDGEGNLFDKTAPMGFDVQITDNDDGLNARNRVYWSNAGAIDECWNNMDDAGHITLDGAEPGIVIESIDLTGGTEITADNGTIQFNAVILPVDATQPYKWVLTNVTGLATITNSGLLTAVRNGTVTVQAASVDNFVQSSEITVTISNQAVTHFESSYIKDGDFTMGTGTTPSLAWEGGAVIENGIMTITNPTAGTNPWDYTVGQVLHIPESMKDMPFVLQFKAWADEARIFDVDIEHGDPFARFGDSPDPRADGGTSQWRLDLTPEPQLFTLEITNFSRMEPLPQSQKFNLFAGMATPKVYIDNLFLVTQEDYVLDSKTLAKSINKVYPNPVGNGNTLFIELSKVNTKVAIYNAVGQKLMEKVATGNLVRFDVSSLRQGMYFVKLSDGSVQKFIR